MGKSSYVQSSLWMTKANDNDVNLKKSYFSLVKEELAIYGLNNVGVKELLAVIMGTTADSGICQQLALLPLARLLSMSSNELQILGATASVAVRLEATFQLFTKLKAQNSCDGGVCVKSPSDAVNSLSFIVNEEQEHFVVLLLNTKNQIKKTVVVTKGIIDSSLAHAREVFKIAIRENAKYIILGHNHPSGDPTPSSVDIDITWQMCEAGRTVGIEVLDHIIVGTNGYKSLKEMGVV